MRDIILKHLLDHMDKDLAEAKARMASLKESLGAESKSSAGDKHETGRAMIHLEQERVQDTVGRLEHMRGIYPRQAPYSRRCICSRGYSCWTLTVWWRVDYTRYISENPWSSRCLWGKHCRCCWNQPTHARKRTPQSNLCKPKR